MNLDFPLPNIRTFVSPFTFPISPFLNGHHCGAEIRNEFSLSVAKNFALFVPTLSSGAIVLPMEKMDQINTKNYWK